MTKFLMLYSSWQDQDLVGWIEVLLLPQSLVWLLGFGGNHSLLSLFNIADIILRPDKYNNTFIFSVTLSVKDRQKMRTGMAMNCPVMMKL